MDPIPGHLGGGGGGGGHRQHQQHATKACRIRGCGQWLHRPMVGGAEVVMIDGSRAGIAHALCSTCGVRLITGGSSDKQHDRFGLSARSESLYT